MNYDFNMAMLLKHFHYDPQELAKEFTTQLNKAITKSPDQLEEFASQVVTEYNDLLDYYNYAVGEVDEYCYLTTEKFLTILEFIIRLMPYAHQYMSHMDKIKEITDPIVDSASNEFSNLVNRFLEKNDRS